MTFEKAEVTRIEMDEEDIIVASGCTTSGYMTEDSCTGGNHKGKYSECDTNGHMYHGGQ